MPSPTGAGGIGLWAGFLDRLPAADAIAAARRIENAGVGTIWLQEYSGVDPFVRAALYLSATSDLVVALGVAVIHGRDPEAMVAVASTLEEAFAGAVRARARRQPQGTGRGARARVRPAARR